MADNGGVQRTQVPFNGNFYDHEGKIRNIDSLSSGGGGGGPSTPFLVYHLARHILTATDISNKYFTITETIEASQITNTAIIVDTDMTDLNDIEAIYPNKISWQGKNLDGMLQEGIQVIVFYPIMSS